MNHLHQIHPYLQSIYPLSYVSSPFHASNFNLLNMSIVFCSCRPQKLPSVQRRVSRCIKESPLMLCYAMTSARNADLTRSAEIEKGRGENCRMHNSVHRICLCDRVEERAEEQFLGARPLGLFNLEGLRQEDLCVVACLVGDSWANLCTANLEDGL